MKEKCIPQRKRLAMGDTLKGYAKGGTVGVVSAPAVVKPSVNSGKQMSPMERAKRNNGVKGM